MASIKNIAIIGFPEEQFTIWKARVRIKWIQGKTDYKTKLSKMLLFL